MVTETISFRLKKETRDLAKKYNIDIAKVAKEKVEEEIEKRKRKEREETLGMAAKVLAKVTKEDIVMAVRKGRDSR